MPARRATERAGGAALIEALFAGTTVAFAFVDADLRFVSVNDAMATQTGGPATGHTSPGVGTADGMRACPTEVQELTASATRSARWASGCMSIRG